MNLILSGVSDGTTIGGRRALHFGRLQLKVFVQIKRNQRKGKQISFRCLGHQWPFQTFSHKSLASLSDIIFHSFSAVSHHNIQPRPLSDHHETGHYNMKIYIILVIIQR